MTSSSAAPQRSNRAIATALWANAALLAATTGGGIIESTTTTPIDFHWPTRTQPLGPIATMTGATLISVALIRWRLK